MINETVSRCPSNQSGSRSSAEAPQSLGDARLNGVSIFIRLWRLLRCKGNLVSRKGHLKLQQTPLYFTAPERPLAVQSLRLIALLRQWRGLWTYMKPVGSSFVFDSFTNPTSYIRDLILISEPPGQHGHHPHYSSCRFGLDILRHCLSVNALPQPRSRRRLHWRSRRWYLSVDICLQWYFLFRAILPQ